MTNKSKAAPRRCDAVIIGAGFSGLYALYRLRTDGYSVCVLEAGDAIGGTWYWNRYPGARCDIESMQYSYSFSEEIQQEWDWSQLYAPQAEILRYINFVADKLNLRRNIQLNTRVKSASFDEAENHWMITTEAGERFLSRFCIMATGCLSIPIVPTFEGLDEFRGQIYRTSEWPHQGVDLVGLRVGLIGTGSSGIQATPVIAEQAKHLYVFQRTPNYSIPAHNRPLEPNFVRGWKANYRERRLAARQTRNNWLNNAGTRPGSEATPEQRWQAFETRWATTGGLGFMHTYTDMTSDREVNADASNFVRAKIASIVRDPKTADMLTPKDYGIGGKRICVDTDYFQTFNRRNVTLVDIRSDPIERLTVEGLRTRSGRQCTLDVIVLAIGFDAMTGALLRIDITGRDGQTLRHKWQAGPTTHIGLAIAGFPNLFVITGPGSPSVFSNMVTSAEQHVDWVADCITYMKKNKHQTIDARADAEADWVAQVNEEASKTIFPTTNSWYVGANIPGKPRVFMPYLGGAAKYNEICQGVAENGYAGFILM